MLPEAISPSEAFIILRGLGVRGALKSGWHSYLNTQKIDRLLMSKNTITNISRKSNIDLESRLIIGLTTSWASHPRLGRSKFFVGENGEVHVPQSGPARVGPCSVMHINGVLQIGNSYINSGLKLVCGEKIVIGDGCAIAWDVNIMDTDRHQLIRQGETYNPDKKVEIKDDVWVGHNVSINKGVTIGRGSVIGSNSVVTKDVPTSTLAVGNPARPIESDISWN